MIEKIKAFLEKDAVYKDLISRVYNNPYEEKKKAFAALGYKNEELEKALEELEKEMIVLTLATHTSGSLESRVLREILLINPDLDDDMAELFIEQ
jgi:hypothetical protein